MSASAAATPDSIGTDRPEVDPCGVDLVAVDLTQAVWRTSSYSGGNGSCVEVADLGEHIAVRDSKDREGPKLVFRREAWERFLGVVKTERPTI